MNNGINKNRVTTANLLTAKQYGTGNWRTMLRSFALILFVTSLWSCAKDEEHKDDDEDDTIGSVYFEEDFEKMIWGGDYINQQPGVKGEFTRDDDNRYIIDESKPVAECGINTDGCPDFFALVSEAYKELRGISGWEGSKVYERPGYLKIGTESSRDAYIRTPPLDMIGEGSVNINVSVDLAIWGGSSQTLYVSVANGGISSVSQLEVTTRDNWTTREFRVLNATKETQIEIKSDPTQVGRFFLGHVKITKAD